MQGHADHPEGVYESIMFRPPSPSRGERAAGWVAAHLANWWVPTIIVLVVGAWVTWNLATKPFQPYPVIVLAVISAILSTFTATQGPLILLAQRRAAMEDRARDEETFRVAIRTEIDLQLVSTQLDEILTRLERLERLDASTPTKATATKAITAAVTNGGTSNGAHLNGTSNGAHLNGSSNGAHLNGTQEQA